MAKKLATGGFVPLAPAKAPVTPPKTGKARIPVLIVAWPPVRDGGPWFVECYAPRDSVAVKIVVPPVAGLDTPESDFLAEEFVRCHIPKSPQWQELLYPGNVVASETLRPYTPADYSDVTENLRLIRELQQCQQTEL